MKTNSDIRPEEFIICKDSTLFNYNIIETEKEDMDGKKRASFDYDYVKIKGRVTREKLIRSMVASKYKIEDEIALINREIDKEGNREAEYDEYSAFRAGIKTIINNVVPKKEVTKK